MAVGNLSQFFNPVTSLACNDNDEDDDNDDGSGGPSDARSSRGITSGRPDFMAARGSREQEGSEKKTTSQLF